MTGDFGGALMVLCVVVIIRALMLDGRRRKERDN